MPNGVLQPEMGPVITEYVTGHTVWDFGAGDLTYAKRLLSLGADQVVAIDKEGFHPTRYQGRKILPVQSYFVDVPVPRGGIDVAWVSWPTNYPLRGLTTLLEAARVVIYFGGNTDGTACGDRELWDHLTFRTILAHIPHRRNSLIVYGEHCGRRPLVGEEVGACCGMMLSFEASQKIASKIQRVLRWDSRFDGVEEP